MASLTEKYPWAVLVHSECKSAAQNFNSIRDVKRQCQDRGVVTFQMQLSEKGKNTVPGLVLSYWRDLDRAFNSAYMDTMQRFVRRAMLNRAVMGARVQQIADSRSKYDAAWCYEWEDCHTRAFLLDHGDEVPKGLFRPLNQLRSVLSGAARARRQDVFKRKVGNKKAAKKPSGDGGEQGPAPLDL